MTWQPKTGETRTAIIRVGMNGISDWKGVVTESDPGGIPPNAFLRAENVRYRGSVIEGRGGPLQVHEGPVISDLPNGMFDFPEGPGTPAIRSDSFIWTHDRGRVATPALTDAGIATSHLAKFGDSLYYGRGQRLIRQGLQTGPNPGRGRIVYDTGNSKLVITGLCAHAGKLYIAIDDSSSATNSSLLSWDGASFATELSSSKRIRGMTSYMSQLVVACISENLIRLNTGGVWTTLAPVSGTFTIYPGTALVDPAGSSASVAYGPSTMAEVGGVLWIASGGATLWGYNGATLSSAGALTGAVSYAAGSPWKYGLIAVVRWNTFQVLLIWNQASPEKWFIGRYDVQATTTPLVEKVVDMTALTSLLYHTYGVFVYRGQLWFPPNIRGPVGNLGPTGWTLGSGTFPMPDHYSVVL